MTTQLQKHLLEGFVDVVDNEQVADVTANDVAIAVGILVRVTVESAPGSSVEEMLSLIGGVARTVEYIEGQA